MTDEAARGFQIDGPFLSRAGNVPSANRVDHKLCLVSTSREVMLDTLRELSRDAHCCVVKIVAQPRGGMYIGRALFDDLQALGVAWAQCNSLEGLEATLQDDRATLAFRERKSLERLLFKRIKDGYDRSDWTVRTLSDILSD